MSRAVASEQDLKYYKRSFIFCVVMLVVSAAFVIPLWKSLRSHQDQIKRDWKPAADVIDKVLPEDTENGYNAQALTARNVILHGPKELLNEGNRVTVYCTDSGKCSDRRPEASILPALVSSLLAGMFFILSMGAGARYFTRKKSRKKELEPDKTPSLT